MPSRPSSRPSPSSISAGTCRHRGEDRDAAATGDADARAEAIADLVASIDGLSPEAADWVQTQDPSDIDPCLRPGEVSSRAALASVFFAAGGGELGQLGGLAGGGGRLHLVRTGMQRRWHRRRAQSRCVPLSCR